MKRSTFITIFCTVVLGALVLSLVGMGNGGSDYRETLRKQATMAAETRQIWASIISSTKEDWKPGHDGKYVLAGTNVMVNICWPFDDKALSLINEGEELITFNRRVVYSRSYDPIMSASETIKFHRTAMDHLLILFGSMVDI